MGKDKHRVHTMPPFPAQASLANSAKQKTRFGGEFRSVYNTGTMWLQLQVRYSVRHACKNVPKYNGYGGEQVATGSSLRNTGISLVCPKKVVGCRGGVASLGSQGNPELKSKPGLTKQA